MAKKPGTDVEILVGGEGKVVWAKRVAILLIIYTPVSSICFDHHVHVLQLSASTFSYCISNDVSQFSITGTLVQMY